ncbi:MAG: hypothetical protein AAF717_00365 [Bacteroidota bacterium]
MSSLDIQLKKALEVFREKGEYNFPLLVSAVDKDQKTIDGFGVDGFNYKGIRLTASIEAKDAVVLYPNVGSTVLVSIIGKSLEHLFVVAVREVESIDAVIGTTELHVDNDGHRIKRNGEDLRTVLNDMIDELNKIFVVNGTTINVAAMNLIKERLNQILKT